MVSRYSKLAKAKQPNTAANRQLQKDWEQLLKMHSPVLEKGAKAKGQRIATDEGAQTFVPNFGATTRKTENPELKISSVAMTGSATQPAFVTEDMKAAKHTVASRAGQAYNKGGIQYLTDDELAEQRTGSHKRR